METYYVSCKKCTANKNSDVRKTEETGDLKHSYGNELHKAYFARGAAYSDSKDLAKRTISEQVLKDKTY